MENDAEEYIEDEESTDVGENAKQVLEMVGCNHNLRQIPDLNSDDAGDDTENTDGYQQETEEYWWKIDGIENESDEEYVECSSEELAHLMKCYLLYLLKLFSNTEYTPLPH